MSATSEKCDELRMANREKRDALEYYEYMVRRVERLKQELAYLREGHTQAVTAAQDKA